MGFASLIAGAALAVGGKKAVKALAGGGGGKAKAMQASPVPTRNAAADLLRSGDEFSRRRGYAANILTGSRGAEAMLGTMGAALGRSG